MFISTAYAQTGAADGGSGMLIQLLPLVLIFVVFYFLLIRPQQKKMREHKSMIDSLRRGDRVVTSGGIIGTVTKVTGDREIGLEIADGVRVRAVRSMIAEVLAKTEPGQARDEKKPATRAASAEPEEYYRVLGVQPNATAEEIDAAYAAKSGDPAATEAYETLKDPVRRKLYDSLGHEEYVSRIKA
ncbi:MAG TPA: preprotein translocase subunit YajC [Alphaproteobacteria bacterium]